MTTKVVQSQRLHVALSIASFVDDDEAADGKVGDLTNKLLVFEIDILVVVTMHDQPLERIVALSVENPALQPW